MLLLTYLTYGDLSIYYLLILTYFYLRSEILPMPLTHLLTCLPVSVTPYLPYLCFPMYFTYLFISLTTKPHLLLHLRWNITSHTCLPACVAVYISASYLPTLFTYLSTYLFDLTYFYLHFEILPIIRSPLPITLICLPILPTYLPIFLPNFSLSYLYLRNITSAIYLPPGLPAYLWVVFLSNLPNCLPTSPT